MLSVIVLFRNSRETSEYCLASLLRVEQMLNPPALEYVLIDDCSEEASGIPALLKQFRSETRWATRIVRFREHRHYAYGVAMGLSLAQGECVLFVSHDMVVAPGCVRTLLELAANGYGIIRPRSRHMDGARPLVLEPPFPLRGVQDVDGFSRLVRQRFGAEVQESRLLIGDAMLIHRSVIERIGVFDTRFYGFMADIDYGVRARRSGVRMVVAMGAWLHHVGSGVSQDAARRGADLAAINERNHADMRRAYEKFRAKWETPLPEDFLSIRSMDELDVLQRLPPGRYDDPPEALKIDPAVCEEL